MTQLLFLWTAMVQFLLAIMEEKLLKLKILASRV